MVTKENIFSIAKQYENLRDLDSLRLAREEKLRLDEESYRDSYKKTEEILNNARTILSSEKVGNIVERANYFTGRLNNIHEALIHGKVLQGYRGIEHYLGAKETNEFKQILEEISDSKKPFYEETLFQKAIAIKFGQNVYLPKLNITETDKLDRLMVDTIPFVVISSVAFLIWISSPEIVLRETQIHPFIFSGIIWSSLIPSTIQRICQLQKNPHQRVGLALEERAKYVTKVIEDFKKYFV